MPTIVDYKGAKELLLLEIDNYLKTYQGNKFFKKEGLERARSLRDYLNDPQHNQNVYILVALIALFSTSSSDLVERVVNKLITEDAHGKCISPVFDQESLTTTINSSSDRERRLTVQGIDDKRHVANNLILLAGVRCGLTIGVPPQNINAGDSQVIVERSEVYKTTETEEAIEERLRLNIDNELIKLQQLVRPIHASTCVLL